MEANFKQALHWVRQSEGGNDDDPADSGGRTSRGITQREWDAYCRIAGLGHSDVWKAPDGAIDDIYHRSYWNPYCPTLPPGVDYLFFDISVLGGLKRAVEALQDALDVGVDGHIGIVTSAAMSHITDLGKVIDDMSAHRLGFYKNLAARRPKDRKFLRGWANRVEFAQKNAHTLL